VRIKLWTHDAQGLTSKDFELAKAIDMLVTQEFPQVKSNAAKGIV
jgi:pterin-4a-carbinolamine dehydratase